MQFTRSSLLRCGLLSATALASAFCFGGAAQAQAVGDFDLNALQFGTTPGYDEHIVANHTVPPGPPTQPAGTPVNNGSIYSNSPQVLHPAGSITGIGQQIAIVPAGVGGTGRALSLCSGTLINPRTVITAAHCVYNFPAHNYGSATGTGNGVPVGFPGLIASNGVPLSFGFSSTNRCLGVAVNGCAVGTGPYEVWRDSGYQTNEALAIYNANQVWYGTGAQPVALGGGGEFANQDIALVTLDTHASGIPTWALLFSQLDEPTHATITGYGGAGVGLSGMGNLAGIDYRRRSAENMIDALMTNHDWVSSPAINPGNNAFIAHQHPIYWLDFDDPDHDPNNLPANFFTNTAPPGQRNNGYYDFNGLGGAALPNEGATAGGDSGGPLIVDQRWDRQVVAGVLTGSWSFNGGISTYGQFNVYPPLFQFWEELVQNNPYVYASAKTGNGDWFDPAHWIQDMDPNYVIIGPDGELLNQLPDNPQGGADGAVDKFGTLCFLEQSCTTFDGPGQPAGDGVPHFTPGGPGSTNFVPNNVEPINSADPTVHRRARYYDVTLRRPGITTLSQAATIDVMTVDGLLSVLDIRPTGTLNTWADFTQNIGITNVDGVLNTNEMLVVSGALSGRGTINADFVTVVGAFVAPGGALRTGTLTVNSDMILASASTYLWEANRTSADRIDVAGVLTLSGGNFVFSPALGSLARHGQSFTVATGDLGVSGTFGHIFSLSLLRPELTYNADNVVAKLKAGSIWQFIGQAGQLEAAFAQALDLLRDNHYNDLYGLYGTIDLMDPATMSTTLRSLAPTIATESQSLQERQSRLMLNGITDRLSTLGTGQTGTLSVTGSPALALAMTQGSAPTYAPVAGLVPTARPVSALPSGMTGFVNSGYITGSSATGVNRLGVAGGRHIAYANMGLEVEASRNLTIGTAIGYAYGFSAPGLDRTDARTTQAVAYGSYRLGGGFYVGGLAAAEISRNSMERQVATGNVSYDLYGATRSSRYEAMVETGTNLGLMGGLTLTPRAALTYSRYNLGGFDERGGEAALRLNEVGLERIDSRLGARLAGQVRIGGWELSPQLQADMVYTLSGADQGLNVSFANIPDFDFALPIANGDSSWGEVRGGFVMSRGPVSFGAGVETSIGRAGYQDHRARADVVLRF